MDVNKRAREMGEYFEQRDPFYELPQADQEAINRAVAEAALSLQGKKVKITPPIYPLADDAFNHLPEADRRELDRRVLAAAERLRAIQRANNPGCLAGIFGLLKH